MALTKKQQKLWNQLYEGKERGMRNNVGDVFAGGIGVAWIIFFLFQIVCYVTSIVIGFGTTWWIGTLCLFPLAGWFNGLVYIGTWGGTDISLKVFTWLTASLCGLPPVV